MSRCKCGKRLTQAELNYKDPTTDQYLDYCFECIDISTVDDDTLDTSYLHIDLEDAEGEIPLEDYSTPDQDMEDLT